MPPVSASPQTGPASQSDPGTFRWGWVLLAGIVLALVLAKWTLLVAVLGLAFLITVHEFGHFVMAKLFGMRVEKFYVGFPPAAWKRQRGETEYGIGLVPLGGFCKISGMSEDEDLPAEVVPRAYYAQPVWKRNLVIAAGPLMNLVAAVVILLVFLLAQGIVQPTLTIENVVKDAPAAAAGLKAGDTLLGGRVVGSGAPFQEWRQWSQASDFLKANPDRAVELRYRTGSGVEKTVTVTLTRNATDAKLGFLGVQPGQQAHRPAPWTAAWLSLKGTGDIIVKTFQGFWWLISGKISATGPSGAAGPVGIIDVSSRAVQQGYYPVLLVLLSVNLAILNLLPLLPFDGGHIFFNTLERIAAVGVALVLTLFVYLTFGDLRRLFG